MLSHSSGWAGGVVWAQQTWSGTITDENGLPLPGATVIVENTPFLGGVFIWINGQYFGGIRQ